MTIVSTAKGTGNVPSTKEVIISADSHVIEPADLWARELPAWAQQHLTYLKPPSGGNVKPGGTDPQARVQEMAMDGVSAEVLYTTLGLRLFAMDHAEAQEAAFEVFNNWLIDYCKPNLDR